MKPLTYETHHTDAGTPQPVAFPLVRQLPNRPALIVSVGNTVRIEHRHNEAHVMRRGEATRVLLAGDWT